ncbi:uncharacterized protein LOC143276989 [Babylonia areolata]|uniref:uncharacterized protein LOC143276989 n=1 Tax=Babylonia areolata TaxID=304850 RepID=UPI003FD235E1
MNARNLAVVLTPSLIRLKARTKLMSPEELRVLPKQTVLIEHLICHADGIGCMTSQLYHHSVEMTEDLLREKLSPKKKKKRYLRTSLEERLGVARAALGLVATLHFRPNTSATVSDTTLVDGPHGQAVPDSSSLQKTSESLEPQLPGGSDGSRKVNSWNRVVMTDHSQRPGPKSEKCGRNSVRLRKVPVCKVMLEPLTQSWSKAIPVLCKSDLDPTVCASVENCWSDEDADTNSDEEEKKLMAKDVVQILNQASVLTSNKSYSHGPDTISSNKTSEITMEDQEDISETQQQLQERTLTSTKLVCDHEPAQSDRQMGNFGSSHSSDSLAKDHKNSDTKLVYGHESAQSDKQRENFESTYSSDSLAKDHKNSDGFSVVNIRKENHQCRTSGESSNCLPGQAPPQPKSADQVPGVSSQHEHPCQEYSGENLNQLPNDTDQKVTLIKLPEDDNKSEFPEQYYSLGDGEECDNSVPKDETARTPPGKTNCSQSPLAQNTNQTNIQTEREDPSLPSCEQNEKDQISRGTRDQYSQGVDSHKFPATSQSPSFCSPHHTSLTSQTEEVPAVHNPAIVDCDRPPPLSYGLQQHTSLNSQIEVFTATQPASIHLAQSMEQIRRVNFHRTKFNYQTFQPTQGECF